MEKVSIIVPVYNAGGLVTRCLQSILAQTYSAIEVIAVDDGSTDDSLQQLIKIASEDNRLYVVHQENSGVSAARNRGLMLVTGEYIMFVDADDFVDVKIVELLLQESKRNKADISIVNKIFHINDKTKQNVLFSEKNICRSNDTDKDLFTLDLLTSYFDPLMNQVEYLSCGVTAKLYRRDLIQKNGIKFQVQCHFGEDVLFNLECFEKANKISYMDFDGYHFRISTESSTHKFQSYWKESHELFVDGIDRFVSKYNKDYRFYEAATMMRASRISGLAVSYYFHKDNPESFIICYKNFKKWVKSEKYWNAINQVRLELLTRKQQIVIRLLRLRQFFIVALISNLKG